PRALRTRVLALFLISMPLSNSIGSPISAHILQMKGVGGLHDWQWIFLLEGAPAIVLGIITWFVLADDPGSAAWLSPEEKALVAHDLASDEAVHSAGQKAATWPRVGKDAITY